MQELPPEIWNYIAFHVRFNTSSSVSEAQQSLKELSLANTVIGGETARILLGYPVLRSVNQLVAFANALKRNPEVKLKSLDLGMIPSFKSGYYTSQEVRDALNGLISASVDTLVVDWEVVGDAFDCLLPLAPSLKVVEVRNGDSRHGIHPLAASSVESFCKALKRERLQRLTIHHAQILFPNLLPDASVSRYQSLKSLIVNVGGVSKMLQAYMSPEYLSSLANFQSLTTLCLSSQAKLDNNILSHLLNNLPNLTGLDISHISRIDDEYVMNVFRQPYNLQYLSMEGCKITDGSMSNLTKSLSSTLISLDLSRTMILGTGLRCLKACYRLRNLGLCQVYTSRLPNACSISWLAPLEWVWDAIDSTYRLQVPKETPAKLVRFD